ncbi:MAG: TonB-dependent siderophore receptor [Methylotenera sp.]|nr:TonB-dependent siderophore receptor [Methylotenera sp.]
MIKSIHLCVLSALAIGFSHSAFADHNETIHLDEISVTEKSLDHSYYVPIANSATKTDTPLMETPLSIQVVDESILRDQNAQTVGDVVRNVSGVQTQYTYGGVNEQYIIRGFQQTTTGYRNGIRVPLLRFDLVNAERVEVLKGPSSMLYGPSDPSGLINIVTKKPQKDATYSFQQSIGMFDFYRTEASATGAIDGAGILTYRVDAAWKQADSYRDVINSNRYVVPMALAFRPNDKLEINLSLEPQRDRVVYDRGVPVVNGKIADVPRSRSFNQNDHDDYKSFSSDLNGSYRFDSGWKLSAGVFNNVQDRDLNLMYFGNVAANGTDINRRTYIGEEHIKSRTSWGNLTGDFETGSIKHKLLIGTEYINTNFSFGVFDRAVDTINIFTFNNQRVNLDPLLTGSYDGFGTYQVRSIGFYAQDQIKFNDQWQLHVGMRRDNVKQDLAFAYESPTDISSRNDSKTTPRIGLLYQPAQWLSLYGNCAESFGMTFNYEADTLYKPEEARQCEAGVKMEVLDGRFNANVAVFDLTKTNIATPNPNTNRTEAIGEAQSKGLEIDVQGKITDKLSAIGSLALTDTEITKDGRGNMGNSLPNAPKYQYSAWLNYSIFGSQRLGLSVGGGLFGNGKRYGDAANSYSDGKYTTVDLYAAYKFMMNKTKVTAQLNVNNVFNEKFYYLRSTSSNLPASPTNAAATIRLDF